MAVTPTGGKESIGKRVSHFVAGLRQLISPVFAQTEVREEEIQAREQAQRDRTSAPAAGPPEADTRSSGAHDPNGVAHGEDTTK